jgi:D-alanyl-D-alanine endopeptidase (penicillin-binding protein 7)
MQGSKKKGPPLLRVGLLALTLGVVAGTFLLQPPVTVVTRPAPAQQEPAAAEQAERPGPAFALPPLLMPPVDPATTEADPLPPLRPTLSMGHAAGLHRTPAPVALTASAALVVDRASGEVLLRKNDSAVLPIASLTKLMSAIVLMEARAPMAENITIAEEDVDRERNSRSRLRVGTTLTRADALHLALMSSENRAAHALARFHPGGVPAFVAAMNAKARALGMKDTRFVDPTGLSSQNQSTARDVALLTGEAARNPLLRAYSTTPQYLAEFGERRILYRNSNRLVKNPEWAIALQKTGYIVEAGQCVAIQAHLGGHDVIMVLLDAGSKSSRSRDAERMRSWILAQWGAAAPDNVAAAKPAPRKATGGKDKVVAKRKPATKREQVAARRNGAKG